MGRPIVNEFTQSKTILKYFDYKGAACVVPEADVEADANPIAKYKKQMQDARAKQEPTILHYLELINKQLDSYFSAPVSREFADKISAIKISGLQLSDLEFELLRDTATTYLECRLLNCLAESRTKTESKHIYDAEHPNGGANGVVDVERRDPYIGLRLPNIDKVYKAFKDYRAAARGLLYSYAGTKAELYEALDENTSLFMTVNMDSYFRDNAAEEFSKVMDEANAILPENKIKRTLTENDKKLIDTLISPNSLPFMAERTVKEIAASSPELKELLLLDERYAKYLEDEEQ